MYDHLPHALLAVAHEDELDAQMAAAKCLQLWDLASTSEKLQAPHPLSEQFLSPDFPLRKCLEAFAQGAALVSLPQLRKALRPFHLISINEQSIEGKHALAKNTLATLPALTSISVHVHEAARDEEQNPG